MWATADAETTGEIYETVPEPYVSRVDEIRWSPKKKKKKKLRMDYLETRLLYRYLRIDINIVKSYEKQAVINGHKLGSK